MSIQRLTSKLEILQLGLCDVTYDYFSGYGGSQWQPPEDPNLEIINIVPLDDSKTPTNGISNKHFAYATYRTWLLLEARERLRSNRVRRYYQSIEGTENE